MTTVYPFNIRYISMHRPYNHTWPHMVSQIFFTDTHINLFYLKCPFSTAISCFWMGYIILLRSRHIACTYVSCIKTVVMTP